MGENDGSDSSEFGSVTSSQTSFLKNCPFADPESHSGGVEETKSDSTEVLGTPISPPVTHTPVLSQSTPISLDSINDEDVFRTPPENASLSSAAESEPGARVSEIKPRRGGGGGSELKSTPVSASPSLTRVTDVTPLTSPPSLAAGNVKVLGGDLKLKSPSAVSASQPLPAETVRDLEMNRVSNHKEPVTEVKPLCSPPSLAASNVRVTVNHSRSPSPTVAASNVRVPDSSSQSATEGIKVTESGDDDEIHGIPFKEVIEALLRNNGENLDERDERVSYVDILKQFGLKFP